MAIRNIYYASFKKRHMTSIHPADVAILLALVVTNGFLSTRVYSFAGSEVTRSAKCIVYVTPLFPRNSVCPFDDTRTTTTTFYGKQLLKRATLVLTYWPVPKGTFFWTTSNFSNVQSILIHIKDHPTGSYKSNVRPIKKKKIKLNKNQNASCCALNFVEKEKGNRQKEYFFGRLRERERKKLRILGEREREPSRTVMETGGTAAEVLATATAAP